MSRSETHFPFCHGKTCLLLLLLLLLLLILLLVLVLMICACRCHDVAVVDIVVVFFFKPSTCPALCDTSPLLRRAPSLTKVRGPFLPSLVCVPALFERRFKPRRRSKCEVPHPQHLRMVHRNAGAALCYHTSSRVVSSLPVPVARLMSSYQFVGDGLKRLSYIVTFTDRRAFCCRFSPLI